MKKAFALTVLLALVLTGCCVTADVTDPTDNSYQTYPTTTNPTQTDPTKDTAMEGTTVPAETEGKTNEKDVPSWTASSLMERGNTNPFTAKHRRK